jgi:hypothetical protein
MAGIRRDGVYRTSEAKYDIDICTVPVRKEIPCWVATTLRLFYNVFFIPEYYFQTFGILLYMKILAEISEGSLEIGESEKLGNEYTLRKSARVILLNKEGDMATQYLETYTYHKLPGGGIDEGETVEEALKEKLQRKLGVTV